MPHSSSRRLQEQLAEYLKSGLSPKVIKKISRLPDEMEAGRFLYNAGYYRALLEFSLNNLRKKKPAPWPFVMKALTDHNISLPKEAVKPLLKFFLTRFEENRLWFSACGEWAKISPEFRALIQSGLKEKPHRFSSDGPKPSPEDTKSALKGSVGYTEEQHPLYENKPPQEEVISLSSAFSPKADLDQNSKQSNLKSLEPEKQSSPQYKTNKPPQEEAISLDLPDFSQISPDQNNEQLNFKTDKHENRPSAHSKKIDKPPLNETAEDSDSISFSEETNSPPGGWDLSKHPEKPKSGFFSSKPVSEGDSVDLEEQQLFRQLEFVQAKGLVEEEEKIIRALMKKNPKKYKDLNKELKMKKALEFLQSQKLSEGEEKSARRFLSQAVSKKESPCKDRICKTAGLLAEKHPERAKDLAVFLYMLGWPDGSLKVLERNLQNISEYWFYLSWLLEVRKYAVALDITNRLFVKLQSDSESLFPITYIKAQALYALGEKDKAVSYMSDIVRVRPAYKSARHFLEEWTKT